MLLVCVWSLWKTPFDLFNCSREKYLASEKSAAQSLAHLQ